MATIRIFLKTLFKPVNLRHYLHLVPGNMAHPHPTLDLLASQTDELPTISIYLHNYQWKLADGDTNVCQANYKLQNV